MQLFVTHFMSSEVLISTNQSVQMYFTIFGFCQTSIFNVTFQGKDFWKKPCIGQNLLTSQDLFLNSVTFGVISGIKCYQFSEFDTS